MHFQKSFCCLLTALSTSSYVLASASHEPTQTLDAEPSLLTPDAALQDYLEYGNDLDNHIELRQATAYNLAATTAPTQAAAVTTFYMQKAVGTTVTYAPFVYTQKFAAVPDQLPLPIAGTIGYGDLVKQGKRDAEPEPTPAGIVLPSPVPLVLELHEVGVTQWLQPVTEITEMVVSTVLPSSISIGAADTSTRTRAGAGMATTHSMSAGNLPAATTETTFTTGRVFPSQMNPEAGHVSLHSTLH